MNICSVYLHFTCGVDWFLFSGGDVVALNAAGTPACSSCVVNAVTAGRQSPRDSRAQLFLLYFLFFLHAQAGAETFTFAAQPVVVLDGARMQSRVQKETCNLRSQDTL